MTGFDPETGEMVEEGGGDELTSLRQRVETLTQARKAVADDLVRAEKELRNQRRKVDALKAELDEQMAQADEMPMVKTIYQGWVQATDRNPKRTKLGPARTKAVLARLREGRDFDYILRAATVGAQAANVSDREGERLGLIAAMKLATELLPDADVRRVKDAYRRAAGTVTKYDDLELICRSEVTLERFAALADRIDPSGTKALLDVSAV